MAVECPPEGEKLTLREEERKGFSNSRRSGGGKQLSIGGLNLECFLRSKLL